jgi:predicted nucleic acid-binding protein
MDALHIAYAEQAQADAFISTDDGLLRVAARHADILKVRVLDPIEFIRSFHHEG